MDKNKKGQGYNDSRGEIDDKKDIPKKNGQNVNNDPKHVQEKEKENPHAAKTSKQKSSAKKL
jgi:hypothetical protein